MIMKTAGVVEFKRHFSAYLALIEGGEEIEVLKRNVPVAHVVGIPGSRGNQTKLGFAKGSVVVKGDLTDPFMPAADWHMLHGGVV